MRMIYQFDWDCGRMGVLNGLFTADSEELASAIGQDVYFGEVLGKHSDIMGTLEKDDCTVLSDDQDFIETFEEIMGRGTISGFNPLDYLELN